MADGTKSGLPAVAANRLRQAGSGAASSHPDANLLVAFSEQALTPPEREGILTHLAQCADCREVVSLCLPPIVEMQEQKQRGATARGGFWLLRPEFMRWAIVGASATVVVAAV